MIDRKKTDVLLPNARVLRALIALTVLANFPQLMLLNLP